MTESTPTLAARLAQDWFSLSPAERLDLFSALPADEADSFFLTLSYHEQAELVLLLSPLQRQIWLRRLAPDDVADLIQQTSEERRHELLNALDELSRREVTALLAYQEDAAGGLMNPRFARVRPDMTADEAISYLRFQARDVETIYYAYVIGNDQRLLGVISFRDLFSAERERPVRDIMHTSFVAVTEEMDQEEVAALFSTHALLAIPVVDAGGRIKGIVTLDDIVDVVTEEASEDIQKIGGMQALDAPYLETSFWQMIRKRAGWLALLFVGEMLTATAMGYFEEEIARAVVLALFIPLIISSGGNSGSQATTLVIRAMAVGEVHLRDWWRVVRREFLSGLVLGSVLGALGVLRIVLGPWLGQDFGRHSLLLGITVGISLVGVVLFGTMAGSMLPFLLRRVGLDPASASAPFVATLVDVSGLVIYFGLAQALLRGTLL